ASSKETGDILTTAPLWFADFHLFDNIAELFTYRDGIYLRWLLNSVLYAALGGAIATLLAAMAGYALAKYRFPGRDLMFDIVLGGVLVPATALALPLFLIFSQAQLT
ncbi:carbohydrate ABC transporter permease, partial [Pseudomonas sp. BGM005]|nr:carbohydrate ABC transporter permease [Pseudomonas sp. BG5]